MGATDVPEHLYDPWTTAKRLASYIGLLDHADIRFLGFRNIEALFAQAMLKIVEVRYVIKTLQETEFAASWSMLSAMAQGAIKTSPYADVHQIVVTTVPPRLSQ